MTVKNPTAPCADTAVVALVRENTDRSNYRAWKCLTQNSTPKLRGKLHQLGVHDDHLMAEIENEALAAFFQNVLRGAFEGKSAISTYLVRIGMNIWFKRIRGSRAGAGKTLRLADLGLAAQVEAYLDKKLGADDRLVFEKKLGADTDLQELLAAAKDSRANGTFCEVNMEEADRIPNPEPDGTENEVRELVEKTFPLDSTCRRTLIGYYFVHAANYEEMVKATKRPNEDYNTVYGRLRRQVARCVEKLRKEL